MPKEPKRIRVTRNQLKILVKEMEDNQNLRDGVVKPNYSSSQRAKDWACLAQKLNAEGGAVKCVEKWKKSWRDYKILLRKKYQDIKLKLEKDGIGTSLQNEIPSLERRVLNLISMDAFHGFKTWKRSMKTNPCVSSELEQTDRDTSSLKERKIPYKVVTRVTQNQLKILVKEMENNQSLNEGIVKSNYSSLQRTKDWACLAKKLNAVGGAVKCVEKWKRTWWDYRLVIKKKYRDIKLGLETADHGLSLQKEISPLERRVLHLMGIDADEGLNHPAEGIKADEAINANLEETEVVTSSENEITPLERRVLNLMGLDAVQKLNVPEILPKIELCFEAAAAEESPWNISQVSSLSKDPLPSDESVISSELQPQTAMTSSSPGEFKVGSSNTENNKHLIEAQLATASAMTEVAKALQSLAENQTKFLEIENRKACAFEKIAEYFCK